MSILITSSGVYATRALYFSVMERGKIPLVFTGTAVGFISLVGYTPDIFAGPAMGYILDNYPGGKGHQYVFLILALFSLMGGVAAWYFHQFYGKKQNLGSISRPT